MLILQILDSSERIDAMTKHDFERQVEWPGKGLMTLGEVFRRLHDVWETNDTIAVRLFARRKDEPHTVIEAWVEPALRRP
jgi:hypothetical protein